MLCFERAPEKERKLRLMFQNVVGTLNVVAVGTGAQEGTRIQACLLSQPLQSNMFFDCSESHYNQKRDRNVAKFGKPLAQEMPQLLK